VTAGNAGKRSQREDAALAALLSELTIAEAATKAGISESTLLRWLRDPTFQGRYREARRQVVEQAIVGLQQAAGDAVTVLSAIAGDATQPAGARVSAARTILDQSFRSLELVDLVERIEQLERAQNGSVE
jgi:DNA-binding MurR/RpiR family transcriptional regulator